MYCDQCGYHVGVYDRLCTKCGGVNIILLDDVIEMLVMSARQQQKAIEEHKQAAPSVVYNNPR